MCSEQDILVFPLLFIKQIFFTNEEEITLRLCISCVISPKGSKYETIYWKSWVANLFVILDSTCDFHSLDSLYLTCESFVVNLWHLIIYSCCKCLVFDNVPSVEFYMLTSI